jgi:hypothetical protein
MDDVERSTSVRKGRRDDCKTERFNCPSSKGCSRRCGPRWHRKSDEGQMVAGVAFAAASKVGAVELRGASAPIKSSLFTFCS